MTVKVIKVIQSKYHFMETVGPLPKSRKIMDILLSLHDIFYVILLGDLISNDIYN